MTNERDDLKTENEALKSEADRYKQEKIKLIFKNLMKT